MKNYLKDYKDEITSVGAIFTALGVVTAVWFSAYNLKPRPDKSAINVLRTRLNDNVERVVIYNGGRGPAVELKVNYPNKLVNVNQLVNYESSNLNNVKFDKGLLVVDPMVRTSVGLCRNDKCTVDVGFLKPGSSFALEFVRNPKTIESIPLKLDCLGEKREISLFDNTN